MPRRREMFFVRTESTISRDIHWILRLEEDHFEYLPFRVLMALSLTSFIRKHPSLHERNK